MLPIDHEHWHRVRELGRGTSAHPPRWFGVVHLAVNDRTGGLFAVKRVRALVWVSSKMENSGFHRKGVSKNEKSKVKNSAKAGSCPP